MPKIADIEYTPNPNAVKFVLREPVTIGASRSYTNEFEAQSDPLASSLFAVGKVTSASAAPLAAPGENPLLDRINALLDDRIRPGLAGDGGGLEIISLNDKTLTIRYQGACGSCPSSMAGTLMAIESMLQQDVDPEIQVISV